jgi:hypothetical protein
MPKVILSTDRNPLYCYFLPLTAWAWKKCGFDPICIIPSCQGISPTEDENWLACARAFSECIVPSIRFYELAVSDDFRLDTQFQVARLFISAWDAIHDDEYLLLGDIDMIPLSGYFHRDFAQINIFGHDLTGYRHIPMCYVGMFAFQWREMMGIERGECIEQWLVQVLSACAGRVASPDINQYWYLDQELLTHKLAAYQHSRPNCRWHFLDRGQYANGLAYGRVDRADWHLNHPELIDAHLPRPGYSPENHRRIMPLLERVWGRSATTWMHDYWSSTPVGKTFWHSLPDVLASLPRQQKAVYLTWQARPFERLGSEIISEYGSHQPVLAALLDRTRGDILELGGGPQSSYLINAVAKSRGRWAATLETNEEYFRRLHQDLHIEGVHDIRLVTDYTREEWRCPELTRPWDLAIVDNSPGESRQSNIAKLAARARFIMVHDSEEPSYGYDFRQFRYVYTFDYYRPYTTVLSNFESFEWEATR